MGANSLKYLFCFLVSFFLFWIWNLSSHDTWSSLAPFVSFLSSWPLPCCICYLDGCADSLILMALALFSLNWYQLSDPHRPDIRYKLAGNVGRHSTAFSHRVNHFIDYNGPCLAPPSYPRSAASLVLYFGTHREASNLLKLKLLTILFDW